MYPWHHSILAILVARRHKRSTHAKHAANCGGPKRSFFGGHRHSSNSERCTPYTPCRRGTVWSNHCSQDTRASKLSFCSAPVAGAKYCVWNWPWSLSSSQFSIRLFISVIWEWISAASGMALVNLSATASKSFATAIAQTAESEPFCNTEGEPFRESQLQIWACRRALRAANARACASNMPQVQTTISMQKMAPLLDKNCAHFQI